MMVLWSTKENDHVHITMWSGSPKGRLGLMIKEPFKSMAWFVHGGSMVRLCMTKSLPKSAIWWFYLPTMRHGQARKAKEEGGRPTAEGDCSMGMLPDRSQFWLTWTLRMKPFNPFN